MKKLFLLSVLALLTSFLNAQTHWTPIDPPGSTGYTATMIGVIKLDGSEQYSDRLEIGVFHGDECRGAGLASTVVSSRNYVFLTVYGIEGEEDTFKIYDHATGAELDASSSQTFIYHDNGNTGTIPSPYVFEFLTNHFVIGVSADPTAGGTVTGGGTYDRDATVNLSATANTGYNFVNWTKGGTQVSTAASFSFAATVATQGDYVAHFTLASCTITATADPTTGGTVSGGGTFTYGSDCTLTASANTGYTFVKWTKNDVQVSDEPTYSFTVEETATYVAHFRLNSYTITATANPAEGGTLSGGGTYNHGAMCTLIAVANAGYTFVNWTKGGSEVSTNDTISFVVDGAATYVANFSLNTYEISATSNPAGGGDITGAGNYNYHETCTLSVATNPGYTFVNWTKGGVEVTTDPSFSFLVEEDAAYQANFNVNGYEIIATADPSEGGTITGAGVYNHFQTCVLIATANTGYTFVNWTKDGSEVSTNDTISFMVEGGATYVAHFEINNYEITVAADPTTGGTVSGGGTYNHGDPCTLIAAANAGYTFVNWTKDGSVVSTNDTISFVVEAAANYIAHFSLNTYEITATSNPAGGGVITGAGNYNYHETCTLSVATNTGYTFVNWTKGGVEVTTEPSFSFLVEEDAAYQANFNVNGYEIIATADPAEGGTITGAGVYNHFQTCVLIATANTGYTFVNWTKDGSVVSTNDTISFMVEGGATYVAHFQINSYDVTATVNPTEGGAVSGTGTYDYGTTVTLSATPAVGYHFLNWTQNGTVVTTDNAISFTVTQDTAFVANFEINSYDITATANPTIGGTITGDGTYTHGTTVTLSATPAEGYHFLNWSQNGTVVSTDPAINFTATQDSAFVAHFEINSYEIAVAADPTTGGTVYGAGTYNHFQTCTLIATAGTGYTFVNWTKGGTVISTSATFSFTVVEAGSYVAHFSLNSYDITATANPSEGGTVTGAGTYNHFETCTLTATPADTYFFVNWTKDGEVVSTEPTYTFTVAGAGDYVANFVLGYIDIVAYSAQPDYGEVSGGGTYLVGSTCTLTAIPNHGFRFLQWAKDHEVVSTDSVYSFVVAEAGTYRALFERVPYSVTVEVNPAEGGTVTGTGDIFYINTTCQLVATPNDGYYFLNWMKDGEVVSTEYIYEFTVTGSEHFVANFAEAWDIDALDEIPIVIYPNPAVDKIVVKSPMAIRQCEVYSITGQCLLRMKDCGEMFEIQLGDFVTGSYLIRMTSDNFDELRKFIKE